MPKGLDRCQRPQEPLQKSKQLSKKLVCNSSLRTAAAWGFDLYNKIPHIGDIFIQLLPVVGPILLGFPFLVGWRKPEKWHSLAQVAGVVALIAAMMTEAVIFAYERGQLHLIGANALNLKPLAPPIYFPTGASIILALLYIFALWGFEKFVVDDV